jgi:aconitase A
MNLHKAPSQRDTQTIQSAKKAIEAIRKITRRNKEHKTGEKRHQPFHPPVDTERKVKPKELTKKAIETLCFNSSNQKPMQTCEICGKTHWPLCTGIVETEEKVTASAVTTVSAEAEGQGEVNLSTMRGVSIITSACECCGEESIEVNHLVRIDSGQLLCPDCLKALREAISKNDTIEHN